MRVCEFCQHYQYGECKLGLNLPKNMSCREFSPVMEQFCAEPKDFVSLGQIVQMAMFFGFQKMELKKIRAMAAKAESAREQKHFDESETIAAAG